MNKEIKLIINYYEDDRIMKETLIPMIEEKFKAQIPSVIIECETTDWERRPTFKGVKDWLILFKIEGYEVPYTLIQKFKDSTWL